MQKLASIAVCACLAGTAWAQKPLFNVLDYGAKNDGSAPSTDAFRQAIQAAAKAGGGTVWVPAGSYVSAAIQLVSNLRLELDSGAVIRFVADRDAYPMVKSRYEGVETMAPAAMIGGENLENVTIAGRGTLMASNPDWRKLAGQDPQWRASWMKVLDLIEHKEPVGGIEKRAHRRFAHHRLAHVDAAHFIFGKRHHPQCHDRNLPGGKYRRHRYRFLPPRAHFGFVFRYRRRCHLSEIGQGRRRAPREPLY
jgi:hypothetical protein